MHNIFAFQQLTFHKIAKHQYITVLYVKCKSR